MDIKFIVILVILIIGIYLIKEILSIKKNINYLVETVDNSVNINIKALKNRLNVVTSEIKNYNNDLVVQIKKINNINSQVVTSMSNYFTESESDGNKNLIDYLSDTKRTDTEFQINFNDEYKQLSQKNVVQINPENPELTESSVNTKSILPTISINSNKSSHTKSHTKSTNSSSNKSKNDNLIIGQNDIISVSDTSDSKLTESSIKREDKREQVDEETEENSKLEETEEIEIEVEEEVEVTDNDSEETEEIEVIEEVTASSTKSSKSGSIKLDNITIGSNTANKGKKIQINDTTSFDTNTVLTMTKLNSISSYTKQNLERIAKILSVPITYLDGNIRKPYKKEELYSKIKDFLNKKSK